MAEKAVRKKQAAAAEAAAEEEKEDLGAQVDETRLKGLKLHQEVLKGDASPLHLIREKELEISGRVLEARKKATETITEARRKAAETVDRADETALKEAEEFRTTELKRTKKEAEEIKASAGGDAKKITEQGKKNFDKAIVFIKEAVMPRE